MPPYLFPQYYRHFIGRISFLNEIFLVLGDRFGGARSVRRREKEGKISGKRPIKEKAHKGHKGH